MQVVVEQTQPVIVFHPVHHLVVIGLSNFAFERIKNVLGGLQILDYLRRSLSFGVVEIPVGVVSRAEMTIRSGFKEEQLVFSVSRSRFILWTLYQRVM